LSPLGELTLARLREFYREPAAVFWTFGFPALLALALGVAFREGATRPAAVVVTPGARQAERVEVLSRDPRFAVSAAGEDEAATAFREGRAVLEVGGGEAIRFRYDPIHPDAEVARLRAEAAIQHAAGRADPLAVETDPVTAHGARYIEFLVPGLIGMNIMSSTMWGIGWVLVEARKRKLLKRLVATPMRRSDYFLSFVIARLVFLATEVAVIVLFGRLVFDVEVQGSLPALALVSLVGAMAFAGLGLVTASRTSSTETVSGLMNLAMLPMFVLSGVFFSTVHFPDWMQPVIHVLPLTMLNDALRAIVNQGAGPIEVAAPFLALAAWTVATFAVALRAFKWT
jgi:ABC-type multidrug transport system permease subunit